MGEVVEFRKGIGQKEMPQKPELLEALYSSPYDVSLHQKIFGSFPQDFYKMAEWINAYGLDSDKQTSVVPREEGEELVIDELFCCVDMQPFKPNPTKLTLGIYSDNNGTIQGYFVTTICMTERSDLADPPSVVVAFMQNFSDDETEYWMPTSIKKQLEEGDTAEDVSDEMIESVIGRVPGITKISLVSCLLDWGDAPLPPSNSEFYPKAA